MKSIRAKAGLYSFAQALCKIFGSWRHQSPTSNDKLRFEIKSGSSSETLFEFVTNQDYGVLIDGSDYFDVDLDITQP